MSTTRTIFKSLGAGLGTGLAVSGAHSLLRNGICFSSPELITCSSPSDALFYSLIYFGIPAIPATLGWFMKFSNDDQRSNQVPTSIPMEEGNTHRSSYGTGL